ncbi:hypothetical protein RHGRI_017511 [Rhododendron griersonianum]|uniref:Uncharacterized protein n=1 Tax=Rhododendron griersonianum TaxID=479676 RepID=A0AAV6JY53_9ERIC|nr:hypothetical protein RHGRI_017511 [Rhododendron griersonianum]
MVAGGSWAFYALRNGYVDGGCMMEVVWVRGCGLIIPLCNDLTCCVHFQVLEFFNRLMIQRVSPKSYQQAIVEVYNLFIIYVVSSYCGEVVESADAYVFVGPIFNNNSLVGYSLPIKKEKSVIVQPNRVTIVNGTLLGWVFMLDFLTALAKKLKNTTTYENYR